MQIQIQKGTIPVLFGIVQIKLFGISNKAFEPQKEASAKLALQTGVSALFTCSGSLRRWAYALASFWGKKCL